uniref:G_PROTEIN_RECEP_F1_2 domain-containing protein n=1 Tax=Rhabditophanes sp. KR3021 TaxID=114890 RepID=A0AC35TYU9_9BILA
MLFTLDKIINLFIFLFSLISNILGLSLFHHFKVSGKINTANWLIFIQCSSDIVFSVSSFLFHSEIATINKYVVFYLINFESVDLHFTVSFLFVYIFLIIAFFNPCIVATMLYTRYKTITNSGVSEKIGMKKVVKILLANTVFIIIAMFSLMYNGFEIDGDPQILYKFDQVNNYTDTYVNENSRAILFNLTSIKYMISIASLVIYITIMLGIIMTYLIKYRAFMTKNLIYMSEMTRMLNNDFFKILLLQTISPILFLFGPFSVAIISILLQIPTRNLITYIFISGSCVPLSNALFLLIFLRKSRDIMKNRFKRLVNSILCKTNQNIFLALTTHTKKD